MDRPLLIVGRTRRQQPPGWGTPMPLLHRSIADIPEKELVGEVLSDPHYRHTLLNIKGLESADADILTEVELRYFRRDLAGDVDILVVPRGAPERSTAIQVKRFKAKAGLADAHTGHPLRLVDVFDKGVRQANDLAKVGSPRSISGCVSRSTHENRILGSTALTEPTPCCDRASIRRSHWRGWTGG